MDKEFKREDVKPEWHSYLEVVHVNASVYSGHVEAVVVALDHLVNQPISCVSLASCNPHTVEEAAIAIAVVHGEATGRSLTVISDCMQACQYFTNCTISKVAATLLSRAGILPSAFPKTSHYLGSLDTMA